MSEDLADTLKERGAVRRAAQDMLARQTYVKDFAKLTLEERSDIIEKFNDKFGDEFRDLDAWKNGQTPPKLMAALGEAEVEYAREQAHASRPHAQSAPAQEPAATTADPKGWGVAHNGNQFTDHPAAETAPPAQAQQEHRYTDLGAERDQQVRDAISGQGTAYGKTVEERKEIIGQALDDGLDPSKPLGAPDRAVSLASLAHMHANGEILAKRAPDDAEVSRFALKDMQEHGGTVPTWSMSRRGEQGRATVTAAHAAGVGEEPKAMSVREAQQILKAEGLNLGPADVDGVQGKFTTAAIEQFQEAKGVPVTGTLDAATVTALRAESKGQGSVVAQAQQSQAQGQQVAQQEPQEKEAHHSGRWRGGGDMDRALGQARHEGAMRRGHDDGFSVSDVTDGIKTASSMARSANRAMNNIGRLFS